MGKNKAELEISGKTFLRILTDKIRSLGIEDIMLSGYGEQTEHTRLIKDLFPGKGNVRGRRGV